MDQLFKYLLSSLFLSTILFANNNSLEKVSLQLQWKHQFEFAGFYMAKEKGYYKDAGLDVELKEFNYGVDITDDVHKGKTTFGINYSNIVLEKANGKDLILLNAILQVSPHILISLKSSGIKSIKDFKNKKIMIGDNAGKTASFVSMLKSHDISIEEMLKVKQTFNMDDLLNGETDIIPAFSSNELYVLDKEGVEYDIWDPRHYGFDFYDVLLFTSSNELKNNHKRVEAFRKASLEGWEYAFENIDETANLILEKYNTQNKTKEALVYEAKVLKELAYTDTKELGNIDKNKIQRIYDIYNLMGLINNKIDLNEFVHQQMSEVKNDILTKHEKKHLENKKNITMCIDPDWMPFEKFENNKHIGMTADYFKLFENSLGINIDIVKTKIWDESIQFAKSRKCDILSLVMPTPQRSKYLNFTEPYLKIPLVLATKTNVPFIDNIALLNNNETVAIPKGYAFVEIFKKKYPKLNIIEVENIKDGLNRVKQGKVFGYIGTVASIGYMFQNDFAGELKIAGKFDETWELGIGVRNDDEILFNIMQKAVRSVDATERQHILNDWIAIKYEQNIDYSLMWKISIFIFVILMLIGYRQYLLKKSYNKLKLAQEKLEAKTLELAKSKDKAELLSKEQSNLLSLFDKGDSVLFKWKNDDTWSVEYVSKSVSKLLGFELEELTSNKIPYSACIHKDDLQHVFSEVTTAIQNNLDFFKHTPYRVFTKSGELKWVLDYTVTQKDDNGNITHFIGYITDITEQKNIHKELDKAKQKAEESDKSKSLFLANMSHEIRTPMNAILGFVDLLKEEDVGRKSSEYVDIIDISSKGLLKIIEDILDFSKIESGKLEIDKVDFNTKAEFEIIMSLFSARCSEKNISLSLNLKKDLPLTINTDPLRIKQVISNLLSNAIKFTDEDKRIKVDISYKSNYLNVSVKDEGKGIVDEKIEHIFESFSQEDSSTTREYGGTGLGLTISSELVKLLGGELKVKSEIGIGSEFYFSIPVTIGAEIEYKKGTINNITFEGKKILLVEDNKANQMFMKVLLKKLHLEFDIANDGVEAVESFNLNRYDAILMDENMPNMNGIGATKQILEVETLNNLSHTPIIALTANALKGDRERFLASGMDEYLTKPVDRKKLSEMLNKFIGK